MDRYAGKPFLRLLDCYVLDAIHQLDDVQRASLQKTEPKLRAAYGVDGSWLEIVRAQMALPDSLSDTIYIQWLAYLSHAKMCGKTVEPNEFVKSFVDANFPIASE
jgi:hypothetical protein